MNNIEVGDYIRTKQGYIAKLININREYGLLEFDKPIYKENYKPSNIISFTKFNKRYLNHRKNPIDLIEVGDYVNGYYCNYITDINTGEKHLCNFDLNTMEWTPLKNIDVWESIVTKQQFEAIEYKIGG